MKSETAVRMFAALAQGTRLDVLRRLVRAGPAGRPAGALAAELDAAAPTMSFHLKELANAGLVASRREGRNVIYAADFDGLRALMTFLMEDCCQGDPALCGPPRRRPTETERETRP
ncbi:MAG: ArsR/SmtB family transcription factor [Parvularculaceae bacterium]